MIINAGVGYRIAGNFDGCWLLKYLTENILMDGQCLLPNTVLPSKFDRLNFDGLVGKRQNRQNFPLYDIQLCYVMIHFMLKSFESTKSF